jgi:PAS domain S-box-containing protein
VTPIALKPCFGCVPVFSWSLLSRFIAIQLDTGSGHTRQLLSIYIANLLLPGLAFSLSYTPWFVRRWRLATLLSCATLLIMGALTSRLTQMGSWNVFIVVLLSVGCAAWVPWGPRWQALLILLCVISLTVAKSYASIHDPLIWYRAAAPLGAIALSPVAALVLERYRRNARRSEAVTRAIIDSAFDGIITMDAHGLVTSWNPKAEVIFGWTYKQALGRKFFELVIPEEERTAYEGGLKRFVATGEWPLLNKTVEFTAIHRSGHRFPAELALSGAYSAGTYIFSAFVRDITERKWADEERSELASIVESAEDAIFSVRPDGIIISWNPGAERLYGYAAEEAVGQPSSILVPPQFLAQSRELIEQMVREERTQHLETQRLRNDGSLVDVALTASPIYSAAGRTTGIAVIARDITVRKRVERELRESEEKFRKVFEASTEVISINSFADGRYVDVNGEFAKMTGYTREEVLGRTPRELRVWASDDDLARVMSDLRSRGFVRDFEADFLTKTGEQRSGLFCAVLVNFAEQRCILSFSRDITERKQAERKLRESEETFRKIFEASTDAITLNTFPEGRHIAVNEEFIKLTGYTRNQVIGRTSRELRIWATRKDAAKAVKELEEKGIVRNLEVEFATRTGGTIASLFSALVMNFHGQRCVLSFVRDIRDCKRAERELIEARKQAIAASEAKSQFLATMSHEIRSPMNAIVGMADVLWETSLTSEQRGYVRIARNAGNTLLSTINDILDLSKIEGGRLELEELDFDLGELVRNAVETFAIGAHEKGLKLFSFIGSGVPLAVRGDPTRLRQVLTNLVGNALKFTKDGEVTVRVENDPAADQPDTLRFSVCDTGVGIPHEKIDTIFDSFTQVDSSITRQYGGSGLGLNICKRLVDLMGGRIWVESEIGKGSTFYFTIRLQPQWAQNAAGTKPLHAGKPGVDELPSESRHSLAGRTIRILLAEDSEDNRVLIQAYLKGASYQLDIAGNGEIAVEKFKSGTYDLILMDMQMPVVDGYTAVRTIREWERATQAMRTPIIALTAYALKQEVQKSLDAGCDAHLSKPIKKAALIEAIVKVTRDTGKQGEPVVVRVEREIGQLVPQFLERKQGDVAAILEHLKHRDYEAVRVLGHNMKGEGGGYGLDAVSEIGSSIEQAARIKDSQQVQGLVASLSAYLNKVQVVYE